MELPLNLACLIEKSCELCSRILVGFLTQTRDGILQTIDQIEELKRSGMEIGDRSNELLVQPLLQDLVCGCPSWLGGIAILEKIPQCIVQGVLERLDLLFDVVHVCLL